MSPLPPLRFPSLPFPHRRRIALGLGLALALSYAAFGLRTLARRCAPGPPARGESRGAFRVHTTRSDGRGTLDEVVAAAHAAGLQFVVVADQDRVTPAEEGYRDGVLVVEAMEASTRFGQLVVLGLSRPLDEDESACDPLGAVEGLGGAAVLAHPQDPQRPFRAFGRGATWRGMEVFSNDASWQKALDEEAYGRILLAALELPFDGGRAVLDVASPPTSELVRFDLENESARRAGRGPGPALLCAADARGFPSYRAAFASVSMHVPVSLTGDGPADARAVTRALLDGSAACVMDGRGALARASLRGGADPDLVLETRSRVADATVRLVRDGWVLGEKPLLLPAGETRLALRSFCKGPCAPGDYRLELRRGGAVWVFTNVVRIE